MGANHNLLSYFLTPGDTRHRSQPIVCKTALLHQQLTLAPLFLPLL